MACGDAYSCFWVYEGFVQINNSGRMTAGLNQPLKAVTDSRIFTVAAAMLIIIIIVDMLKGYYRVQ